MKNNKFSVESKSGTLKSISFRTRWLLDKDSKKYFEARDAESHAECRGRVACSHAECRGRVACGNPTKAGDNPKITLLQLTEYYKKNLGDIPNKTASVFELLAIKDKLFNS